MASLAHADGNPENQENARAFINGLKSTDFFHCRPSRQNEVEKTIFSLLDAIASGKTVQVVEEKDELTPTEAAKLLNVSRPFLDKLLGQGLIPFRKLPTSTHRRILRKDIDRFKEEHDKKARRALQEMSRVSQEMGMDD